MNDPHAAPPPPPPERRRFLKWLTNGLGALFGVVLGIPAIAYLLDPRNRPVPAGDFKTVGRLSGLKAETPQQVVIRAVRWDAWTLHPNDVIGRVWLVRRGGEQVDAYTTICPHLGCSINYEENKKQFICPCHNGTWDLATCQPVKFENRTNPAPRGMDRLELQLVRDGASPADKPDFFIQVKYQTFQQGKETPIPTV
jgi:Rieske Fe-S protein